MQQDWPLFSPMQCLENCGWKALCYWESPYPCPSWKQKLNATVLQTWACLSLAKVTRCFSGVLNPCVSSASVTGISHRLVLSFYPLSFSFCNWNNVFPAQYPNCLEPALSMQLWSLGITPIHLSEGSHFWNLNKLKYLALLRRSEITEINMQWT